MVNKNMIKSKKGQEEVIGFVLIVVLVAIIALVFLVINLRKPVERLPSAELESFLQSSMYYSTDCFISPETRYSLKEIIVSCAETNDLCLNSKTVCQTLNETATRLLKEGIAPCSDCPKKAYRFRVFDGNRTVIELKEGNCTGDRVFSQLFLHVYSGKLTNELEICS